MPWCTCKTKCNGGAEVTQSNYNRHSKYRKAEAIEFAPNPLGASNQTLQRRTLSQTRVEAEGRVRRRKRRKKEKSRANSPEPEPIAGPSSVNSETIHLPGDDEALSDRQPNPSDTDVLVNTPPDHDHASHSAELLNSPSSVNPLEPTEPLPSHNPLPIPAEDNNTVLSDPEQYEDEAGEGTFAVGDAEIPTLEEVLENLLLSTQLPDLQIALQFVEMVRTATLDDSGLSADELEALRNPPDPRDILEDADSPAFVHSLENFIAASSGTTPDSTYNTFRAAYLRRHPEEVLLSFDQIKRTVARLTGIVMLTHHMCFDSCAAFTGPWKALSKCPVCNAERYEDDGVTPRKEFWTFLLGPQLQAQYLRDDGSLDYRIQATEKLLSAVTGRDIKLQSRTDYIHGEAYIAALNAGKIKKESVVLLWSGDGAQLYRDKDSDVWLSIFAQLELPPSLRYKVKHVLPDTVVPGPKAPKNHISFLFPTMYHLSALMREGLMLWKQELKLFTSRDLFLAFACMDAVAMAAVSGWVGHHGKLGCRFMCGMPGRNKPRSPHYYPIMKKPTGYNHGTSDHPSIECKDLPPLGSPERYRTSLQKVLSSSSQADYERNRRETGLAKPSIFCGLPESNCFDLPGIWTADTLHHPGLNTPECLVRLWRGSFERTSTDKDPWPWAVLVGDVWERHGALVSAATEYLPGSFGRTPRNPALKINSGYKACEYMTWLYGLAPGLLYSVLPDMYWSHFCLLVKGLRIVLAAEVTDAELHSAHQAFLAFVELFEDIYVQSKISRMHFVRQSIHTLTHLVPETLRVGPLPLVAQWMMERTVGNLRAELRQHSNPYANLRERAHRRAVVNALKAMFPFLETDPNQLPMKSIAAGSGYHLLPRKVDKRKVSVQHCCGETILDAIQRYVSENELVPILEEDEPDDDIRIIRHARLRLPNGQTARSLWNETNRKKRPRRARMVKVRYQDNPIHYAEAWFYFRLETESGIQNLALLSVFRPPDEEMRKKSHGTLLVCQYEGIGNLAVVPVNCLMSVVAMVPYPHSPRDDLYFVVEKLGHIIGDASPPDAPEEEEEPEQDS